VAWTQSAAAQEHAAAQTNMGVLCERGEGRGLHSFTFQLNVSAFCGIEGALRVCLGVILRVFRECRGVLGV
jgi:TPR repeat protein